KAADSFGSGLHSGLYRLLDGVIEVPGPLPTRANAAIAHDAFGVNHDVGRKGTHVERPLDMMVAIQILRPDHLVLSGEIFPFGLIGIRADSDDHERRVFGVSPSQITYRWHGVPARWAPGSPEIQHHHFAPQILERNVLTFRCGQREV